MHPLPGPALLFCPGDRPDRYGKAAAAADAVILDLEDAVAPLDKPAARQALVAAAPDPARTLVRINQVGGEHWRADLDAVARTAIRLVVVAKASSAQDLSAVLDAVPDARVLALCETARGVLAAPELAAHPAVAGLMWGAEDLVASLGGTSSRRPDGGYRDVARAARSQVLLAAGAYGKIAVDAVHLDIADLDGLAAEAEDAAASGFSATACIHPTQVAAIRAAYRPSAERVEWARAVLAAAEGAPGVFRFRGQMIDEPVLAQARGLLG
nr:CoA ester lyase [Nakamurella alba]